MPCIPPKSIIPQPLKPINTNTAGIDIGSSEIYVAVPPDRDEQSIRSFSSFTCDLYNLAHWLKNCSITSVAMESTGVYWIPLFRPSQDIRRLRTIARQRDMLLKYRSAHVPAKRYKRTSQTETGVDMNKWPSVKHFASWLCLAPNNRITGGKIISTASIKTTNRAAQAFRLAARSLYHSHSALGASYRRVQALHGPQLAIKRLTRKAADFGFQLVPLSPPLVT
jgi:hypothetical protein